MDTNNASAGWDFSNITPYGGVTGRRIAAAIAAVAALNPSVAGVIPRFVTGAFWNPADKVFALNGYDPNRFAAPQGDSPFSDEQINQVLWNQQQRCNFYMFGAMLDPNRDTFIQRMYRGEADHAGFPPYVSHPGVFVPGGSSYAPPPQEAAFPHPMLFSLVPGIAGHMHAEPIVESMASDHYIADPWWDLSTDANFARYIRSFAISVGVSVDPNPGD